MRAGGIQPPFQDVPLDDQGAWELTITVTLFARAGVHDNRTGGHLGHQIRWLHPVQAFAGGLE